MNRTSQSAASLKLVPDAEPGIQWPDYPRIEPGVYPAYCRFAKKYFDHKFKRWTCLLRFDVRSTDLFHVIAARIPMWLNLGNNKEKPSAPRRSRYFKEWMRANSGLPPVRDDRLSPRIFTYRIATVEIGNTKIAPVYSVVRKIISWDTGAGQQVNKSHSQERHGSKR